MNKPSLRYRISRALPLWLVAGLCSLAPTTGSASTWSTTQVDNTADVGKYASLGVDGSKNLHISYFDAAGNLKYTTNKSGSWPVNPAAVVTGSVVAAGTSLALDESGSPQVNFYYNSSQNNRGVRNSVFNGSSWTTNSITSFAPVIDGSTSIVNKGGYTSMVFVKTNGGGTSTLNYTKNLTAGSYTSWATPVAIDSANGSGTYNSMVLDSAGNLHVVGFNTVTPALTYYTNASGSWVLTALTTTGETIGKWCSLAIDSGNNLHLAYLATTASPASYRIKYRYKPTGGAWQAETDVDDAGANGGYPSIKVDGTGHAHISFYFSTGAGSGKLRYATNLGGSWVGEDVDTTAANVGMYSSVAIDSDQTVSVAYYDVTNSALRVATRKALLFNDVNFGTVDRGFQSAATMTVTNNLPVPITLGSLAVTGSNLSEFGVDGNNCSGLSVPAQGSCSVGLHFAPDAGDPRSSNRFATASMPSTSPYPAVSAALSGTTSANYLVTADIVNGINNGVGSISPATAAVAPGSSQSFTVTANTGFSIGSVLDDTTPMSAPYTLVNVSADHKVHAHLVSPIRMFDTSTFYGTLQNAFDDANTNYTVQAQGSTQAGDLLIVRDVPVTLIGGYDSSFTSQSGLTGMTGNIVISNGTLTVDSIQMQ